MASTLEVPPQLCTSLIARVRLARSRPAGGAPPEPPDDRLSDASLRGSLNAEMPPQLCTSLLARVRLARSRLPADLPSALDALPKLSANQRRVLGMHALLSRNAGLRRAHTEVEQRDPLAIDDEHDALLDKLALQARAARAELAEQMKRHHHSTNDVAREAALGLAQSRHLVSYASEVLDGGSEENAVDSRAWALADELVADAVEHSRSLRALCKQVLVAADADAQSSSAPV